jgi:branched-subunit amino acid transport protein AzlD
MSAAQGSQSGSSNSPALIAGVAVGVLAFLAALIIGQSTRAWEAFLVNLLFWMGLAQGAIVVSAACYLAQGRWGGPAAYRLAEAFGGFLIPGFVLFWALYFGRETIFPWVSHPIPRLAPWLNVPFMFARDGIGLAWMTLLSLWFLSASRKAETIKWVESAREIEMPPKAIRRLAPTLAISYFVVYTILAFDLIMSLSPRWSSTLFGVYYLESVFWAGLAAMSFAAVRLRSRLRPDSRFASPQVLHDLGKLVFAFSIFWVYLGYDQYLPIWYGDMPRETFFVAPRFAHLPWAVLGWSTLVLVWAVPFIVLMGKRPKQTPGILGTVCLLGLIGIWIELYVLVTPSLSPRHIPFGWIEVLVTLGFFAAFRLSTRGGFERLLAVANTPAAEVAR